VSNILITRKLTGGADISITQDADNKSNKKLLLAALMILAKFKNVQKIDIDFEALR